MAPWTAEQTDTTPRDQAPGVALEWIGVSRRFGNTVALDNVSLQVRRGTIHALVGENGAGKSTLLKIAAGLVRPQTGTVRILGKEVRLRNAADAARAGIGTVHQHFMLVEPFRNSENLALGLEPTTLGPLGWLSRSRLDNSLRDLSHKFGLPLDPAAITGTLGVGQRQRLEILKALRRDSPILALDEPTAVLAPQEIDSLLRTLLDLRDAGRTIILVSHKLREVLDVSDRITVLRRGRLVDTVNGRETNADHLSRLIIGAAEDDPVPSVIGPHQPAAMDAEPILSVAGLELQVPKPGGGWHRVLRGVTLEVAPGEILAVAGIEGNGQSELVACLAGRTLPDDGRVMLAGKEITQLTTAQRRAAGMGIIPEDRHRQGLVLDMSVADNLRLGRHRLRAPIPVDDLLEKFDVRPRNPRLPVSALSGGNQQKLLLAREATLPGLRILVVSQPTRGVDLGAIALIHQALLDLRASGVAILLISSELDEVLALGDRVAVMRDGRVVWTGDNDNLDAREVGCHMLGSNSSAEFDALAEERRQAAAGAMRA
jgi:simple sugar transport system ATP-binding protein